MAQGAAQRCAAHRVHAPRSSPQPARRAYLRRAGGAGGDCGGGGGGHGPGRSGGDGSGDGGVGTVGARVPPLRADATLLAALPQLHATEAVGGAVYALLMAGVRLLALRAFSRFGLFFISHHRAYAAPQALGFCVAAPAAVLPQRLMAGALVVLLCDYGPLAAEQVQRVMA